MGWGGIDRYGWARGVSQDLDSTVERTEEDVGEALRRAVLAVA